MCSDFNTLYYFDISACNYHFSSSSDEHDDDDAVQALGRGYQTRLATIVIVTAVVILSGSSMIPPSLEKNVFNDTPKGDG